MTPYRTVFQEEFNLNPSCRKWFFVTSWQL